MTPTAAPSRWPVRAAGLAIIALFIVLIGRYWHPVYGFTSLIQLDGASDEMKTSTFHELPVYVHRDTGGYDGLYYAQLALDPSLRNPEFPKAMDNFSYRARRILPPTLAWTLGLGRPGWIIHTYPLLNLIAWFTLAWLLWRLLAVADFRGWLAWAGVLFSAGAIASVRLALTDLIALTIIAGALLAAERARPKTASVLLAAAALARETSLLAFAGLAERPWISFRNVLRAGVVAAPLALWLGYIRWRTGPADAGWANFMLPGSGLAEKWGQSVAAIWTVGDHILAWTTLLATLGLTAQAFFFATRWQLNDRWWRIGIAYTVIMLFLGTAVWEDFPGAAMRVLLPLTLAFNVLAHRTRAALAWLLAGNLTVFAGFVALRDVPHDSRELAALGPFNASGTACIARVGEGWYGREVKGDRQWAWCGGKGVLTLEAWPRATAPVQLDFSLRSLDQRTVVVRQNGTEVWRGPTSPTLTHFTVPLKIEQGRATIEFTSEQPPVREGPNADARALAFALYNLRVTLPQP